jgi:hypothetical protein
MAGQHPTPTPMTTLKEQILEFVRGRGHVTLPQICRQFEAARGELSFRSRNFENVVFWEGLSREAMEALEELLEEKAIFMHPASLREYVAGDDWAMLLLPVAMSGRSYASAHWRVVTLSRSP